MFCLARILWIYKIERRRDAKTFHCERRTLLSLTLNTLHVKNEISGGGIFQ